MPFFLRWWRLNSGLCILGTHTVNELTPLPKPRVLISNAAKKKSSSPSASVLSGLLAG